MRKRGERTLKDLYCLTGKITEPEITPVLEGNCRIQGPVDELDHGFQRMNSGSFQADNTFALMNKGFHMRVESGTCNVCSALCSSCMHNNRALLAMESKIECGSSRNSCTTKEADSSSFICSDGMSLCKSKRCDEHAASEASNFVSSDSSHGSHSENGESKAKVRSSSACEGSQDVDMPSFKPLREAVADQTLRRKGSDMDDCLLNIHVTSDLRHSTCLNNGKQWGLECLGENISCITGTVDSNINLDPDSTDLGQKNATCTALSGILFRGSEDNTTQDELTNFSNGSKNEERQSNHRRQITSSEETFRKKGTNFTNTFSDKSEFKEVPIPNHNSCPKIQSANPPFQNGHVVCHNGDRKDSVDGSGCQPCTGGESSLGTELAVATYEKKKLSSNNGNNKAVYAEGGKVFSADVVKMTDKFTENEDALGEAIKSKGVNNKPETARSLVGLPVVQEPLPQLQQVMDGQSYEPEPELTDARVCDICGDAGREELLAVCSRCSDGAEHTYCMRKMMRKIPEGDWLCEECQLKDDAERNKVDMPEKVSTEAKEYKVLEDTEAKKADRLKKLSEKAKHYRLKECGEVMKRVGSETVFGISKESKEEDTGNNRNVDESEIIPEMAKPTCLNETSPKFLSSSTSKVLSKLDLIPVNKDMRRVLGGLQSPKFSAKRHVESQEVMLSSKRKTPEISGEGIEIGSPRKKPVLLRECSFKNLDTGKAKVPSTATSNGGQSPKGPQGFSRTQSLSNSHLSKVEAQLQSPHGFLSRSSSFNNLNLKPKVKQLTESVPVKPKFSREFSFNDTRKEALSRLMTKSASFKSMVAGRSNTESSKTKFISQSRVEEPRCLKHAKERNKVEKNSSSDLNRPPTNSSPRAGAITPLSKMDIKTAQHDAKLNNALARNETKKHSVSSAKPLGSSSLIAKGCNEDQTSGQTPKEGACGSSISNDKLCINAEAIQHRRVVHSTGSKHQNDKTKDPSIFSNSRKVDSGGNQMLCCQRCDGSDHATQFCSIDKVRSSALNPMAQKNSRDGNTKVNRWKEVVRTTISNSRLQKKKKQNDQLEEFTVSSADLSSEVGSNDFLSSFSIHTGECPLVVRTSDEQGISQSSDVDYKKTAHVTEVGQESFPPAKASFSSSALQTLESSCTPEPNNINPTAAFSDDSNVKHFLHILPDQASVHANVCRSSAIPELELTWQGSLEVLTTGKESTSFDGIQAHMSASASRRVLEVATKFPFRVQLEEVSWSNSWPLQSQGVSPDERSIALFFFAKDVESYERSYSKLLEKMLKNDLALRGFIDEVEILIFPSTKLPVHSQRWNRLFFLWGTFKGRRTDSLTSKLSSGKRPSWPILGRELAIKDPPCALKSVISGFQTAFSVEVPQNKLARCDITLDKSITQVETWPVSSHSSHKVGDRMCRDEDSLVHSPLLQPAAYSSLPSEQSNYLFPISHSLYKENQLSSLSSGLLESRSLVAETFPCSEGKNGDSYQKNFGFRERHVNQSDEQIVLGRVSPLSCISSECRLGSRETSEKRSEEEKMKSEVIFYNESQRNMNATNLLSWEKLNRKQVRSCSVEAISQVSGETAKNISETALLKDEVDYLSTYATADDVREWKKMHPKEADASSYLIKESLNAKSSSKVHPMMPSFLNEQQKESRVYCKTAVIPNNSVRQAEFFLEAQPSPVQNTHSENLIHILSSDDEDSPESDAPDLELALGGKWRTKKRRTEEPAEDDVSASLSLSLAISTPKKEWSRPILKPERHLQDRPDLNTPLFLFDGVTDN